MSDSAWKWPKSAPHHVNSGARHVLDSLSSWTPYTRARSHHCRVAAAGQHASYPSAMHCRTPYSITECQSCPIPHPSLLALSLALWTHQSGATMAAAAEAPWPPRFSSGFSSGPTNPPTPSSIRAAPSHRVVPLASLLQLAAIGAAVAAAACVRGRATLGLLRPS